jgi:hypothetical protein
MKFPLILCASFLAAASGAAAYQSLYDRTPSGEVELKELPARVALETAGGEDYFEDADGLFMRLFRYIDANEIEMTTPVETDVKPARMRFFLGADATNHTVAATGVVEVVEIPAATVVSAGLRGRYTRENYDKGLARVKTWLAAHPEWQAAGEAYAVYWDSPFVPPFLRRAEVHQPVVKAGSSVAGG